VTAGGSRHRFTPERWPNVGLKGVRATTYDLARLATSGMGLKKEGGGGCRRPRTWEAVNAGRFRTGGEPARVQKSAHRFDDGGKGPVKKKRQLAMNLVLKKSD